MNREFVKKLAELDFVGFSNQNMETRNLTFWALAVHTW